MQNILIDGAVLIDGAWRASRGSAFFHSSNPAARADLLEEYPVSDWTDADTALESAALAATEMRRLSPHVLAAFLENYAGRIEGKKESLVEMAHAESALPRTPRLGDVEFPRTTGQLRQAAAAARKGDWAMATIDRGANIRSCLGPIGPVAVFGPNNFPFAFNSMAGGDFAAAIAAGNPVIAKANTSHPGTTRLFAIEAQIAAEETGLPRGAVQMLYRLSHADGNRLAADPRLGAIAYTGSREGGLRLKAAADEVGKPIYLELSSINPVIFLPGSLQERGAELAAEYATSCLMGCGQFCTNPGLVLLLAGDDTEKFIAGIAEKFSEAPVGTLLSERVEQSLQKSVAHLQNNGAKLIVGGTPGGGTGASFSNTLLKASGNEFLNNRHELQTEAFGNVGLVVVCADEKELMRVLAALEGNLTGCIYSARDGKDDGLYDQIAPTLRKKVGRLLNDKMPTGVAVSPAMNHGGPFPSTGHPGFTAVGIPAALRRFGVLQCYDAVRSHRLPPILQDKNPCGAWRWIDGKWTQEDVPVG